MSFPGGFEWVLIFLVILLLFGGSKLPELARGLGKAIRTFRQEAEGVKREFEKAAEAPLTEGEEAKSESKEQPTPSTK